VTFRFRQSTLFGRGLERITGGLARIGLTEYQSTGVLAQFFSFDLFFTNFIVETV
jgi:hypothetical protein